MRNQSSSSFSSESREKISPLLSSSISATSFISFFESKTASSDIPSLVAALDNASLSKLLTIVQNRVDESSLYLASGGNSSSSSDSFVPPSENIDPSDIDSTLNSNSIGVAISLLNYSTRLLSNIFDILEAPPSSFSSARSLGILIRRLPCGGYKSKSLSGSNMPASYIYGIMVYLDHPFLP